MNINILLSGMLDMLEKTLTVRIKLVLTLHKDIWPIWINSADMEDVILNLVINAMHAIGDTNPNNCGVVTIQTQNITIDQEDTKLIRLTNSGDYIKLSINDTGCGMDAITKEKIFDPFYTTKGDKGTGLGLSQVYGFVERMNGAIEVYSELGCGTEFVIYIPRNQDTNSEKTLVENKQPILIEGHTKILVVDDEPDLLRLTCEILEIQNYRVFSAKDAKQALKILQVEPIDIMLSDVVMPEMNGFQLATIVSKMYPKIKIQMVSGFTDDSNTIEVDDSLKKNLLCKPFTPQELLLKIQALLRSFKEK